MSLLPPRPLRTLYRENRWAFGIWVFSGLVLGVFLILKMDRLTDNPRSRIITVERLVENGTWTHATPGDTTRFPLSIDHVKVGEALYSSKPPNYPLLMAGEAWVVRKITGWEFYPKRVNYLRILVMVNQIIPYLIMMLLSFWLLREFTKDGWTQAFMMAAMGLGILPFGYAVTINNHTVSAVIFFVGFALAYWATRRTGVGVAAYAGIGLLVGFGASIELPGVVFTLWVLGMLVRGNWRLGMVACVSAAIPAVVQAGIFYGISGSFLPYYMQGALYRYEGSYWTKPEGLDMLREPRGLYAFHSLIGHHGLFSLTPLFGLSVLGIWRSMRDKAFGLRLEYWGLLAGMGAILGFVILRTYNYGGYCIGLRWLIPFMPLLMWMAWPEVQRMGRTGWGRVVCLCLLGWSMWWNVEALHWEAFIRSSWEMGWRAMFGG